MSIGISTVTESLELYKLLQYDTQSQALFAVISEVMDAWVDGKLDINQIVNTISSRSPAELQELIDQAQIITAQVQKITASLSQA